MYVTCAGILSKNKSRLKDGSLINDTAFRIIECKLLWADCNNDVSHVSTEPSARTGRSSFISSPSDDTIAIILLYSTKINYIFFIPLLFNFIY